MTTCFTEAAKFSHWSPCNFGLQFSNHKYISCQFTLCMNLHVAVTVRLSESWRNIREIFLAGVENANARRRRERSYRLWSPNR